MSQDTFPFAEGDETPSVEESSSNRKAALVAGGVAAALVLGGAGYFFLGGSSDTPTDTAFVPNHGFRAVVAAPRTATNVAKQLPAPYKATLGRDPFKALYVVPVAAAAAAAPATTTGALTSTTPTSTNAAGPGSSTPTSTSTSTGPGTTTPTSTRYTLKLVSISKPSPEVRFTTWKVGTDSKTVIPAQRFGKYGEIVVLAFNKNAQGAVDKAVIQVGDDSPMDVAIGESVSVL
ncbi:MAG: hypothetical protein NVS3B26_14710 [Mycobacteriales bacterium]